MLKKAVLCGTAVCLLAGLFHLSLYRHWPHADRGTIAHRIAHIGAFGALALLLLPLARSRRDIWLITVAIFCASFGMELTQYYVFHFARDRQPVEWWDVRDNTVGLLLALLAVRFTRLRT